MLSAKFFARQIAGPLASLSPRLASYLGYGHSISGYFRGSYRLKPWEITCYTSVIAGSRRRLIPPEGKLKMARSSRRSLFFVVLIILSFAFWACYPGEDYPRRRIGLDSDIR